MGAAAARPRLRRIPFGRPVTVLPIALTTGEPAGIGPEICMIVAARSDLPIVVIGDRTHLEARMRHVGTVVDLPAYRPGEEVRGPSLLHVPASFPAIPPTLATPIS